MAEEVLARCRAEIRQASKPVDVAFTQHDGENAHQTMTLSAEALLLQIHTPGVFIVLNTWSGQIALSNVLHCERKGRRPKRSLAVSI